MRRVNKKKLKEGEKIEIGMGPTSNIHRISTTHCQGENVGFCSKNILSVRKNQTCCYLFPFLFSLLSVFCLCNFVVCFLKSLLPRVLTKKNHICSPEQERTVGRRRKEKKSI